MSPISLVSLTPTPGGPQGFPPTPIPAVTPATPMQGVGPGMVTTPRRTAHEDAAYKDIAPFIEGFVEINTALKSANHTDDVTALRMRAAKLKAGVISFREDFLLRDPVPMGVILYIRDEMIPTVDAITINNRDLAALAETDGIRIFLEKRFLESVWTVSDFTKAQDALDYRLTPVVRRRPLTSIGGQYGMQIYESLRLMLDAATADGFDAKDRADSMASEIRPKIAGFRSVKVAKEWTIERRQEAAELLRPIYTELIRAPAVLGGFRHDVQNAVEYVQEELLENRRIPQLFYYGVLAQKWAHEKRTGAWDATKQQFARGVLDSLPTARAMSAKGVGREISLYTKSARDAVRHVIKTIDMNAVTATERVASHLHYYRTTIDRIIGRSDIQTMTSSDMLAALRLIVLFTRHTHDVKIEQPSRVSGEEYKEAIQVIGLLMGTLDPYVAGISRIDGDAERALRNINRRAWTPNDQKIIARYHQYLKDKEVVETLKTLPFFLDLLRYRKQVEDKLWLVLESGRKIIGTRPQ